MDPAKTGSLIRELRKEQGMTQKDLAEQLHITDRAVSKWERGLCAPDISLLEPLAAALGISILELIEGVRSQRPEPSEQLAAHTKQVLAYSQSELAHKLRAARNRYLALLAACLLAAGLLLWRSGALFVIDKSLSPPTGRPASRYTARAFTWAVSPIFPWRTPPSCWSKGAAAPRPTSPMETVPIRGSGGRRTAPSM